jgi:glycosyltransferase involved in cell wall biosynthesis
MASMSAARHPMGKNEVQPLAAADPQGPLGAPGEPLAAPGHPRMTDVGAAAVDHRQKTADPELGVLICLAASKISESDLASYQAMPNATILTVGDDARTPAPNLLRLRTRRVPYLGAPERWTAALSWFRGLNRIDPGPIDCVLSLELHNPTSLQANRLAKRLNAIHVVMVAEILPNNPLYSLPPWREVAWHISHSADGFVGGVELARSFAISKGCPPERCVVINPGIDLERFVPNPAGRAEDPVLVFVGELRPDKGIRQVIAATEAARRCIRDLRLVIVGDGPLRQEVEAHSRRAPFIEYRGKMPRHELPAIYQQARGFILAPYSRVWWAEQFGYASIEAMATGLPVVITDCGAVRKVVPAWNPICPQNDVAALAAGIIAAMGSEGAEWGRRNRASAEERFDMRVQAGKLRTWLGELVADQR